MQRLRTRLRASASRGAPAALSLDFLSASGTLDPRITFSRGSNATLTDSTGKITYAPTNLLTNSESFDNAAWQKVGAGTGSAASVTANAAAAPNGTTTADLIAFNLNGGTTTSDRSQLNQTITGVVGVSYLFSVYIKAATAGDVGKSVRVTLSGVGGGVNITLTNSYQRISQYGVAASTSISPIIETRGTFNENQVSIHLWGAQLEPVTYQTTPGTYNSTTPKNLLGFTQEFDNAAWTKTNATVTANAVYAPDGTLSADKLVETTAASVHQTSQIYSGGLVGGIYTFSAYLAKGERTKAFFSVTDNATGDGRVIVDLDAGTIGTPTVSGNWSDVSATIQAVSGNFYRVSLTLKKAAGGNSNVVPIIGLYTTTNNYTGDGTSGIYAWGAQLSDSASLDPYVYNPAAAAASTAYYGPRFDYDPVTLAAKGLLIEEARTNLLTYSQQFDDVAWVKTAATVTANTVVSPDGSISADTLREDTTNAGHTAESASVSFTSGVSYTLSVYAKAATGTRGVCLRFSSSAFPTSSRTAFFSLASGTVVSNEAGTTASITNIGNGWYRCTMTATANATATVSGAFIIMTDASNNRVYTGDGTSSIYIYGAQLEAGSFATSYIPTVASQVTRSADVATMIGDNFRSWYNLNAGTFTVEFTPDLGLVSNTNRVLAVSQSGAAARVIDIYPSGSNWTNYNGTNATVIGAASVTSAPQKIAAAYQSGSYAYALNGGTVATDSATLVNVPTQMAIGHTVNVNQLNGHLRSIGYYNTRQPNATLQTLTNPSTTPSLALNFISDTYTVGA